MEPKVLKVSPETTKITTATLHVHVSMYSNPVHQRDSAPCRFPPPQPLPTSPNMHAAFSAGFIYKTHTQNTQLFFIIQKIHTCSKGLQTFNQKKKRLLCVCVWEGGLFV